MSSNIYGTISNMNTYTMCVETGRISYQLIDNGVRIIYDIGNDEITYKNFPKYIRQERLEELVLQYLNEAESKVNSIGSTMERLLGYSSLSISNSALSAINSS